jgi:uncharacterized protein (TIGR02453 family)
MELIKRSTLGFLKDLKNNNNRDWFSQNRSLYMDARKNFESFIRGIIDQIIEFEPILKGLEVGNCVFRINRDIRFSNDKSPYKTNMGAFIVRGGKKNGDRFAGYYIHIEPGASFIAGGAYMPPAPWLTAIREKIDEEAETLLKIMSDEKFIRYFGQFGGEKLKTAPKGYRPDHPNIELLKLKSYVVVNEVPDKKVVSSDYPGYVMEIIRAIKPLNDYLNDY